MHRENDNSSSIIPSHASTSLWQMLPTDILTLIVEILSSYPQELFAPLACSRVCSHWRRVILGTPSLWLFIDTSRGPNFTQLWLTNSNQSLLNVRLCDQPLRKKYLKRMPLQTPTHLCSSPQQTGPIPENIKQHIGRWRSLDILLSCTCRIAKVLEFLGQIPETLHLDSLTIGPMGGASLWLDDTSIRHASHPARYIADPSVLQSKFQNIKVQPVALRIDTYPVYFNPTVFSPRLTALEIFLGNYLVHDPAFAEWQNILLSAPNLVELSLWDPGHAPLGPVQSPQNRERIQLRSLRTLKLSGRYTRLSSLLSGSPLPSLRYLLLDSLNTTTIIPKDLADIASVSPILDHVSIGSMSHGVGKTNTRLWTKAFESLPSLRELKFMEMEWREVVMALERLAELPHNLSRLQLQQIWDMGPYDWSRLLTPSNEMPLVDLIDCLERAVQYSNDCSCSKTIDDYESGSESNCK